MTADELLRHLEGVRRSGDGWVARCPAHEDRHASLSIADRDGTLLAKCHAGCSFDAILAAVPAPAPAERLIDATYVYRDEAGTPLYEVVRYRPKDFRQRRPDGRWGISGVRRVPYRLPELLASSRGVVVVEGEKDADRLAALGIVATCNAGGAGKWRPEYAEPLRGRTVVIIPDNDEPGRAHAADVARSLDGAADVRLLELPGLPPKGDVSDWLDAGHTPDELRELLRSAPPFLSVADPVPSNRKQSAVIFRPARDLVAEAPAGVDWLAAPWVASGAITELDGAPKASGKTTFATHLVAALLDGLPFLGGPTVATPVVYLSEQPPASLRPALERAGLVATDRLEIVLWRDVLGIPWPEVVAACVERCEEIGARLLVVDTLPQFAALRGDAENDAGAALQALEPLQAATARGLAVLVLRHDRKGGGEVGESARGSSAFTGAVDIVLALRRPPTPPRPTVRILAALSRFDETPPETAVELTDRGYVSLGDMAAVALAEARDAILAELADEPLTEAEIVERTDKKRDTVRAALAGLLGAETVKRTGHGKRGDPYRYVRSDSSFLSVGPLGWDQQQKSTTPPDLLAEAQRIFGDDLPGAA